MLAVLALPFSAKADVATAPPEVPVVFSADEVTYDSELEIVRASGNVEAWHNDRILLADTVAYNQRADVLTASGNVALVEPTGEVLFAGYMELTGDMKNGVTEDFRAILADGSRLAANAARRSDGNRTELRKGVYSPCNLCPEDPRRAPLWQLKAVKVVHNQVEKTVELSDTWLEVAGVPVAYTPYLTFPDPTVARKTGLLAPTFGSSSDLGLVAKIPVFWAFAPNQDVTITPWITSNEGPLLELEYRNALTRGEIEATGSITQDSEENVRGHVFGKARYDFDQTWRGGLDVQRTDGDTYLRRYGFGDERTLTSRLFSEGFWRRHYLVANAYAFQGLEEEDDLNTTPLVLPMVDYYHSGERDGFGGRTEARVGMMALGRDDGADSRRVSARAGWQKPFLGPLGEVYSVNVGLWGDGYSVDDQPPGDGASRYSGNTGRLFPQASFDWRWPFVNDGDPFAQLVEPIVEFVAAPNYGNTGKIPNEDSRYLELQETNLFGMSRYPGIDRVEEGPRFNYGFKWSGYGTEDAQAALTVGQVYRFQKDDNLGQESGLQDEFSDYVSAVRLSPGEYIDVLYRNRLDKQDFSARRHELGADVGVDVLRLDTTYVLFEDNEESDLQGREQLDFKLTSQLSRFWEARIFGIRDLEGAGTQRLLGLRLTYEDECLVFAIQYSREDFEDRDLEPTDAVFFRISFKTLGDVGSGFKSRGGRLGG
jgi:LPS-assembly protein